MYDDVICAISTANTRSAISIVRLSGKGSIDIVNKIFRGKDLTKVKSHTVHYGYIYDGDQMLDEVLISVFKAPRTYTKEDVVEINCHGGVFVTNKVLELCIVKGARLAEPGEFTKRAFLNGRIDLTQAEAVMDVIDAKNKETLKMSNYGLRGDIKRIIQEFRSKILEIILKIEVNIDYPEYEDEEQITKEYLIPSIKENIEEIEIIIAKSENSIKIKEGITTAIIGKPNVGKSSILNALLRENKAIVTDIAGTTRDVVEGSVNIGGLTLNLIDTAGVRQTDDIIEQIGVLKTQEVLEKAELIILVFDYSSKLDSNDLKIINLTKDKHVLTVINKKDLPQKIDLSLFDNYIIISAFDEKDIETLEKAVKKVCDIQQIDDSEVKYVTSIRAITKLKKALQSLKEGLKALESGMPIDLASTDLRSAWQNLGEILGEVSSEELLDEMFSQFCLGK
ncbi:MAG TPA: tRNA uridine-5-carboxymethylaminomethyl(34) synthesis GTPase MnmE [Bacilli bacterium]|nr:tRNA uridine-5-carboxymethylaminomethyl(34) synthesis GTPase MnmE [Bacilli bacterium]HPV54938.1 tRNA uridine-5-carboxymethylaminomethyl(34) synthesis GTPase MnmE [Bacilli bacterium]HQO94123.1 tRNA uridine-5-carboxymethylaminomethyl(34) synthesis GTPase MnmE [Bacilli bacterium]HQQ38942.1 tRNA uridine-5-carboxymethylaminomethyl(34) synthesis GTPase MnmE [Bacilli bacterium]